MTGILNILAGSISSAIKDGYFNLVSLLLPGDGTNGAQNNTFLDSSSNNFTITRNGNTTQGTFSPFSQTGWSIYSDGGNNILTVSSTSPANFGSGAMTIEMWVYLTSTTSTQYFASNYQNGTNGWGIGYSSSTGKFGVNLAGDGYSIVTDSTVSANRWYHLAVSGTKTSPGIKFFLDGVQQGSTFTGTVNFDSTNALVIGDGAGAASTQRLNGYLSNLRLVKGTALYTSNFTPSTTPLTAITNTSLLTCQDNRFKDNSTNNYTFAVTGTPSVQAFSPFAPTAAYSAATNGGSGYFDGTGDYLSIPSNAAFQFGTGDFTIECWFYDEGTSSSYPGLISSNTGWASGSTALRFNNLGNRKFGFFHNPSGDPFFSSTNTFASYQWNHVAVTRSGTTLRMFVNGALEATGTNSNSISLDHSSGVWIGQGFDGSSSIKGKVSGVRIMKGVAQYTSAFTPPTAPPTAVSGTSFLANFTNAGITDATAKNDLETVGNAQISTTQSKFGGSSLYFDGTGDWLFARYNQDLELGSGDFTIECWVYFSTLPSNAAAAIASYGDTDGTPRWIFYYDSRTGSANGLRFTVVNGSGTSIVLVEGGGTSGWAANTWYHVAITRSGSSWRLFRDGTQTGSTLTDTDAIPAASNNGLYIGSENGSIPLTGYIDDFRITKGYARYTANFSAPTAAFPVQ